MRSGARELRLVSQLRLPPGGRNGRIMLLAQFLDRTGSGVWGASSVVYFTFVGGFDARQLGLLFGAAGAAGIVGSPLAGSLAERFAVRPVLIGCHLLRFATLSGLMFCSDFGSVVVAVAATCVGDRGAKTMEIVFATRVAGTRRSTYLALSRSASNAGYALGAAIAAVGLVVGTPAAYRVLIVGDALSFLAVAGMVWRTREPGPFEEAGSRHNDPTQATQPVGSPWRDLGYLLFALLDVAMNLDDSILNVGLPLWLVHRTKAPHALVPAFLVINTVAVVVLQMRVSARVNDPRRAAAAVALNGITILTCCIVLATTTHAGVLLASAAMLATAMLVTVAELMRSVSSWELAVSLAPPAARGAYLGVAGMSQSLQKSAGPMLLTGAVMTTGPVGWLLLGSAVAGVSVTQWRCCLRRLDRHAAAS